MLQEFRERLRAVRRQRKLTQEQLAAAVDVSAPAVSQWETGASETDFQTVKRLAQVLNVTTDYLLGDEKQATTPLSDPPEAWADFRLLPVQAVTAAGTALHKPVDPKDARHYAFRDDFLERLFGKRASRDAARILVLKVGDRQDSMYPTIRPGALVVADRGPGGEGIADLARVRDGRIYVCKPGSEGITLKRVHRAGKGLILSSDNDRYQPAHVDLAGRNLQDVLLGLVVWVGQEEEGREK